MGGNAINNAVRLNKDEYFTLCAEVLELLAPFMQMNDIRCKAIDAYRSKPTFGDMDIIVEDNGTYIEWFDIINDVFHSKEIVHTKNSPVISFEYKGFQIDLIFTTSKYYDFAVHYYSYNDICNLIGRITDAMGFKFGHNGLWYHYKNLDEGIDEKFCMTTSFKDALEVFGFSYERFLQGFDTLEDIFLYISTNKYFQPELYLLENINHQGRTRDKKRKTYQEFLKYCQNIVATESVHTFNRDSDFIYVAKFFPKIHIQLNNAKFIARTIKCAKQYFNAHEIVKHTGFSGKNLGFYIKATMDKFPDKFDWAVYCLASPHSEILELMDKNYREVINDKTTC